VHANLTDIDDGFLRGKRSTSDRHTAAAAWRDRSLTPRSSHLRAIADREVSLAAKEPIVDICEIACHLHHPGVPGFVVMPAMCTERVAMSMKNRT